MPSDAICSAISSHTTIHFNFFNFAFGIIIDFCGITDVNDAGATANAFKSSEF